MSRDISAACLAAIYAPQTAKVFVDLLTIEHEDWASTIRLARDRVDVVSRGNTYTAFPFDAQLVAERAEELPKAEISVGFFTAEMIAAIRSISTPPTVSIEVVLADAPDTVEVSVLGLQATQCTYDRNGFVLTLEAEPLLSEPYPHGIFSPAGFPGIFKAV